MNPARYAKAIVAALSAGLLAAQTAVRMSDQAHSWVTVGVAVLAAIAVYAVPNASAAPAQPGPRRCPLTNRWRSVAPLAGPPRRAGPDHRRSLSPPPS